MRQALPARNGRAITSATDPTPRTWTMTSADIRRRCRATTYLGPNAACTKVWSGIYRDWLPATGDVLRDLAPVELYMNNPATPPPAQLRTDIHMALQ